MSGSLNDILPDPITQADEEILLELLKRKMTVMAEIAGISNHYRFVFLIGKTAKR